MQLRGEFDEAAIELTAAGIESGGIKKHVCKSAKIDVAT